MKLKATGMARAVDALGRVVIPKEIRTALGWQTGEPLAIYTEGDRVILHKEIPVCVFCGSHAETQSHLGKLVCADCLAELKKL